MYLLFCPPVYAWRRLSSSKSLLSYGQRRTSTKKKKDAAKAAETTTAIFDESKDTLIFDLMTRPDPDQYLKLSKG
jgi:hypothetical protein